MKSAIWLSFDLGLRGDYEGIYTWLDQQEAKECGDSLAFIKYDHDGDLLSTLKTDLEDAIEITKKTRIYVTFRNQDTGKPKGKFIIGSRKAAPWSGYAGDNGQEEDEL